MVSKTVNKWCQATLPDNFYRMSRDTLAIQQFLKKQLPEPMNQQVTVANLTSEAIVIAVTDPQIANYLRLYITEIQQQIQETFNLKQMIKIKTMPGVLLQIDNTLPTAKKPTKVTPETAQTLRRGSDWIEDEALKLALKSLATTLHQSG